MYEYLKGTLVNIISKKNNYYIVIDVNNVGFCVLINERFKCELKNSLNKVIKVYVSLIHKEDAMTLCGFNSKEERDIFNILISVSGVGIKVANILLNEFNCFELISIVINENVKELSKAKGVGAKLAAKIIIELKDKFLNMDNIDGKNEFVNNVNNCCDINTNEVYKVLTSLGYSEKEASLAIDNVLGKIDVKETNCEIILKLSLKYLSQLHSG